MSYKHKDTRTFHNLVYPELSYKDILMFLYNCLATVLLCIQVKPMRLVFVEEENECINKMVASCTISVLFKQYNHQMKYTKIKSE